MRNLDRPTANGVLWKKLWYEICSDLLQLSLYAGGLFYVDFIGRSDSCCDWVCVLQDSLILDRVTT